ncbi:MAG: RNA methyltransferase [Clostridia bacterium]|nr:RNA methyltransferase [Clostridia bacterium]
MINIISSKDNKNLKLIRQLNKKSFRADTGQFIAEGKKIVLEVFEYASDKLCYIVVSDTFSKKEPSVLETASKHCENIYIVPDNIFADLSDTNTPQGILAVLNMSDDVFTPTPCTRHIVVLDGISEPGNMGTVIRTAEALGFDGIYLMKGCTDIYSPKTVRSTMGSLLRMNFRTNCTLQDVEDLKNMGFSIIATTPGGNVCLEDFNVPEKLAVVIGNEAHGICDDLLSLADNRVKITMNGMAESLNAAVAAGIVMHWLKNC